MKKGRANYSFSLKLNNNKQINEMLPSEEQKKLKKSRSDIISTAEAFYLVFRALPKKDRLAIVRYILEDEDIRQSIELLNIPNETTLKAFAEDKSALPVFHSIEELRKDLLS